MKHFSVGWLSDICICGKKFDNRMKYYEHSAECKAQNLYRKASGVKQS